MKEVVVDKYEIEKEIFFYGTIASGGHTCTTIQIIKMKDSLFIRILVKNNIL